MRRCPAQKLWLASLLVLVMLVVGCSSKSDNLPNEVAAGYGSLPLVLQTEHEGLLNEISQLVEEEATPEMLTSVAPDDAQSKTGRPIAPPDDQNVAVGLVEAFEELPVGAIDEQAAAIMPEGRFQFDPITLQRVIEFRTDFEALRQKARKALNRSSCDFRIQFTQGDLADLSFLPAVRVAVRLEAFLAAEHLAAGRVDEATESLAAMLRMIHLLSMERHRTTRQQAAHLRTEALLVLEAIAQHPATTHDTLGRLYDLMLVQLVAWPSDADAWIGDRAIGLHCYEMLRDGYLLSLLPEDELRQFREQGSLDALARALSVSIDDDEMFYLDTMRSIIQDCGRPYYQRRGKLRDLRHRLHKMSTTPDYPIVADRLLLGEIEESQRLLARDRALCEAWVLALAEAADVTPPPYETNPLTGEPYRVERAAGRIAIRGIEHGSAARPVIIPLLPGESAATEPGP